MKGVNSQIKTTQSQLNDVKKLLKMDPGNTELLGQKQKLLSQAVEETKQKLSQLKTAEKQVEQQFAEGKVSEQQYNALKREIQDTEISLKSLEEQAANANVALTKIGQAGNAVKDFGGKVSAAGQSMTKVTAGITAMAGASVAAWNTLDEAYDNIAKGTGAVGDALADLQGSFDNVFTSIPTDAATAGTAIADLNTRFGFTGQTLEDASRSFIKFADVNNTDVSTAIKNVSRYMGDASIESSQYGEVLDALTAASQASGLGVDQLSESLTKYGAPMRALGLTTQESIAIFAGWEKAGVNTEIAFSGMKKAIGTWGKEGKDARVEFKKTLDEIAAAPDISAATTKAIEVFGQKAGPDLADAIKGGRFEYEDFLKIINASGGQLEATWSATQDPIDKFKTAMNGVQKAAADFGGEILSVLSPMLEKLAEKVKEVGQWFSNLSDSQKELIVKIGMLVAAIGPILMVLGPVISSLGSLMVGFSKVGSVLSVVKGALTGFSAALAGISAPVLAVVAVIAGLVAVFATLYTTNDNFRASAQGVWTQIQSIITTAVGLIQQIIQTFVQVVNTIWNEYGENIASVVQSAFGLVQSIIETALTFIQDLVSVVLAVINGDWDAAWEAIKELTSNLFDGIKDIISSAMDLIGNVIQLGLQVVQNLWDGLKSAVVSIVTAIKDKAVALFQNIVEGVKEKAGQIANAVETGLNAAIEFIASLPGKFLSWGRDMIDNLVKGIQEGISAVGDAVKSVADKIKAFLHFSEPDEGPLSNFHTFMPDMIKLMVSGIRSGIPDVAAATSELAKAASPASETGIGATLAGGIADAVKANAENAKKNAEEMAEAVIKAAEDKLDNYKVYNDLMLADEVAFWDSVRKQVQDGTQAKIDADEKYFKAKKDLNSKMQDAEEKYTDNVAKAYENLNKKIKDLNQQYRDAVDSRTDEIRNAYGLFDEFKMDTDLTSDDLLNNLRSQVDGLRDWEKNLDELADRGVGDDLIQELQDLGPQSAAQVKLLTQMTDDELDSYVSLFRTKNRLARKQAVSELQPMQQDIASQINQLKSETSKELAEYQQEYISAMSELGMAINKPAEDMKLYMAQNAVELVSALATTVQTESSSTENTEKFKAIADNILNASSTLPADMQTVGTTAMNGMITGIQSKEAELYSLVQGIVQNVTSAMQSALFGMTDLSQVSMGGMNATMNAGKVRERTVSSSRYSINDVMGLLSSYLPEIAKQKFVTLDGKAIVGQTAATMDKELGGMQAMKRRVIG